MSWLWSSAPPENEAEAPPTESTYSDPYLTTGSFGSSSPSSEPQSFGSAFDDDPDVLNDPTSSSPGQEASFDIFAAPPPVGAPFDASDTPTLSGGAIDIGAGLPGSGSPPAVDFSSMARIDPGLLSARRDAGGIGGPSVDYVFSEDYSEFRKKSSSEQLTYLTGSAYLIGSAFGATAGLREAIPASAGKATRLRVNAILNAVAKRGTGLGNACAVLALTFSLSEAALYNYTNDETLGNYAAAGAAAGALFKSTRGVRAAGIWGAAGAGVALATVYASRRGYYGRGLQGVL